MELPDKTLVDFRYKLPSLLIQDQINTIISNYAELDGVTRVEVTTVAVNSACL
jgi:hypothetical protein